jgi:hypothetical protein
MSKKTRPTPISALKDGRPNTVPVTTGPELCKIAHAYYTNLFQQVQPDPDALSTAIRTLKQEKDAIILTVAQRQTLTALDEPINLDELHQAIRHLKNNKAPGPDGIPGELYKTFIDTLSPIMLKEMNGYLIEGKDLTGLNDGIVTLLYKKNDPTLLQNYRPITLLNIYYKIFSGIIARRLQKAVSPLIHDSQHAFLKGRHIHDAIHDVQTWIQNNQHNDPATECLMIFLDQEKAYDKTSQTYLFECLKTFNIPERMRTAIEGLYKRFTARIRVNDQYTDSVEFKQGVKQGDPLSCILFVIIMETLGSSLRASGINSTMYADDTALKLTNSHTDWEKANTQLDIFQKATRGRFNENKTEYIIVNEPTIRLPMTINGNILPPPTPSESPVRYLGAPVGKHLNYEAITTDLLKGYIKKASDLHLTRYNILERRQIIGTWIYPKLDFMAQIIPIDGKLIRNFDATMNNIIFAKPHRFDTEAAHWIRPAAMAVPKTHGGMGGTSGPLIRDIRLIQATREWCNPAFRPKNEWQRSIAVSIANHLQKMQPSLTKNMTQERLQSLYFNPILQNPPEMGYLTHSVPLFWSKAIKITTTSLAHDGMTTELLLAPYAWSRFYPPPPKGCGSSFNQLMLTNAVTFSDIQLILFPEQTFHLPLSEKDKHRLRRKDIIGKRITDTKIKGIKTTVTKHMPELLAILLALKSAAEGKTGHKEVPQEIHLRIGDHRVPIQGPMRDLHKKWVLAQAALSIAAKPAKYLEKGFPSDKGWLTIWKAPVDIKTKLLTYRAVRETLPLNYKHSTEKLCPICKQHEETYAHLFNHCAPLQSLRLTVMDTFRNDNSSTTLNLTPTLENIALSNNPALWIVAIAEYINVVWQLRNTAKHTRILIDSDFASAQTTWDKAYTCSRKWKALSTKPGGTDTEESDTIPTSPIPPTFNFDIDTVAGA